MCKMSIKIEGLGNDITKKIEGNRHMAEHVTAMRYEDRGQHTVCLLG